MPRLSRALPEPRDGTLVVLYDDPCDDGPRLVWRDDYVAAQCGHNGARRWFDQQAWADGAPATWDDITGPAATAHIVPTQPDARTRPGITITRDQLERWAGQPLTDGQAAEIQDCIPTSSIPEAIATIADRFCTEENE